MGECCHINKKEILPIFKNKLVVVIFVVLLLFLASYFLPFLEIFRKHFIMYSKSIWWAVLLGLLLGGCIDYYVPKEYISKTLSKKSPTTIFKAVFLGFLMSTCSHGILALSMQIHKKGASNPAVVSFLLASPWANFTFTIMLIGFFGLKGLLIIAAAIIVAFNTGIIFMFLEKKGLIETNTNTVVVSDDFSIIKDFKKRINNYKFSSRNIAAQLKGVFKGSIELSNMVL